MKRNVPHFNPLSNITKPDNSNVVAGCFFGNLCVHPGSKSQAAPTSGEYVIFRYLLPMLL